MTPVGRELSSVGENCLPQTGPSLESSAAHHAIGDG